MPKSVKIAVLQLNAAPAPVQARLERAEKTIARCVENQPQLVVLPEVFNTGYEYSDQNYRRAESLDGETATWMRNTAARYQIHLAGSFLRRDQNHIFNTLLLAAPDGREWHYDKHYPWMWERAYFQPGTEWSVADTGLGKIGFLICWDVAHPNLWQKYSGKVQLMIVSSCPPNVLDSTLCFPNGELAASKNPGMFANHIKRTSDKTFGKYLRRQASVLEVPVAHATGTGRFSSSIPHPKSSLALFSLLNPQLWKYWSQFDHVRLDAGYFNETYLADSSGTILQSVPAGAEGAAVGSVTLPDTPPTPKRRQPSFGISLFTYLYDRIANQVMTSDYKKKIRGGK